MEPTQNPNNPQAPVNTTPPPVVTPQAKAQIIAAPENNPSKRPSNQWIIIGLIIVVLLAGSGLLAYQFLFNKSLPQNQTSSQLNNPQKVTNTADSVKINPADKQLEKDLLGIESNLASLDEDDANLDQALNDQAADLSE